MRKGPSKIDPEFTIGRAWIQAIIELLNKESYLFNTRCFPPPVFSFTPNLDFFGGIEKRSKFGVFWCKKFLSQNLNTVNSECGESGPNSCDGESPICPWDIVKRSPAAVQQLKFPNVQMSRCPSPFREGVRFQLRLVNFFIRRGHLDFIVAGSFLQLLRYEVKSALETAVNSAG